MSLLRKVMHFVGRIVVEELAVAVTNPIGEAIGKRIARKIYVDPDPPKKDGDHDDKEEAEDE